MFGQARVNPEHAAEAILPVAYPPRVMALYEWPSYPLANQDASRGILASAANYGQGLKSVSNKPSEVNVGNMPVYFVRYQSASLKSPAQTRRVLSRTIPGG